MQFSMRSYVFLLLCLATSLADAFLPTGSSSKLAFVARYLSSPTTRTSDRSRTTTLQLADDNSSSSSSTSSDTPSLQRVPPDMEGIPIPFVDETANSFIECYADTVATIGGNEYTIGVPCDYSVALCYFDDDEQLVPVELDDDLMNDIFPMAESIVSEEFGEELVLSRTPQTLTLVGELEEDDDERFEEDPDMAMDDDDDEDDEEEVEVLLSFEHRGKEFSLVRLLDPILLVGKKSDEDPEKRVLLTQEESDKVMPTLEEMFLEFHDDPDAILP